MIRSSDFKISPYQLFALLICSRIIVTITFSVNTQSHTVNNGDWFSSLLLIPVLLIGGIPFFLLCKRDKTKSVIDCAYDISPPFGHITALLYTVFFTFVPCVSVARFNVFVTSAIQIEQPAYFYPVLVLIAVAFAVSRGIEAISRTGALTTVIGGGILLVILIILIKRFDFSNISSPVYNGMGNILNTVSIMLANSVEAVAILVIFPFVRSNAHRSYRFFVVFSGIMIGIIMLAVILVLGSYAAVQEFPFHMAAGVAQLGSLKRLDAFQTAVWLVGCFIKSSFFVYLSSESLKRIVPSKFKTVAIIAVCAVVAAISTIFSADIFTISILYNHYLTLVGVILLAFIIPLLIYFLTKKQYKKSEAEI